VSRAFEGITCLLLGGRSRKKKYYEAILLKSFLPTLDQFFFRSVVGWDTTLIKTPKIWLVVAKLWIFAPSWFRDPAWIIYNDVIGRASSGNKNCCLNIMCAKCIQNHWGTGMSLDIFCVFLQAFLRICR